MPGRKYLVGAKYLIWVQIITIMNQFKPYFEVLQQNEIFMQHVLIKVGFH
jgi:hypothetical protein